MFAVKELQLTGIQSFRTAKKAGRRLYLLSRTLFFPREMEACYLLLSFYNQNLNNGKYCLLYTSDAADELRGV